MSTRPNLTRRGCGPQLAHFVRDRSDPGSYHLAGGADLGYGQLVDFDNEAFHDGTGSNRWSVGIALIMRAREWTTWDQPARLNNLIEVGAHMAAEVARWHQANGRPAPRPVLLTREQSEQPDAFRVHLPRPPRSRAPI